MFSGICCGFDSMKIDNRNSFLFVSDPITDFFFFFNYYLFISFYTFISKEANVRTSRQY